ncbi:M20 metallopeptidase family protein [Sciscionella sediminilitoris]|uniref:M20 metallopeptidase family protein n=1 Tax=Sciscionella sediminilitoris TaxID=1445613 RepID=UPI0004DEE260|nr:M20 family metallopeptidase [Sciscionella sp. SE31]
MSVLEDARAMQEQLVHWRHALHTEPEIGLDLPRTQEKVLTALDGLPLEIGTGTGTTSVTATLRGTGEGPTVLLRGDMDALPVQENTGLDYTSRVANRMHACGHDLHTSMLLGAAHLLAGQRDKLAGDIVFMFQPGEEGYDGASVMLDEGVLSAGGKDTDAAYAVHVSSMRLPHGVFATRKGTIMSASDTLHVEVHGSGGHGSAPQFTSDPVTAISEMVTALQSMITRQFDVFDPVVISVGSLHAGAVSNVIPETARFDATVRTFSETARERVQERVRTVLGGIAASHRVDVEIDYQSGYPPTVTDAEETAFTGGVIEELFGAERHQVLADPLTGSEDFSRVLGEVPGSFVMLGAVPPEGDPETAAYNHSPLAVFDDRVLSDGAALYAQLGLTRTAK